MFLRCGEQWRQRYIEGRIAPPGIVLIIGSATDISVNENMSAKMETGEMIPVEKAKDLARDSVKAQFKKSEIKLDEIEKEKGVKVVEGETIDQAVILSELHYNEVAPKIQPISVQRYFELEIDGFPFDKLIGYMDIEEDIPYGRLNFLYRRVHFRINFWIRKKIP